VCIQYINILYSRLTFSARSGWPNPFWTARAANLPFIYIYVYIYVCVYIYILGSPFLLSPAGQILLQPHVQQIFSRCRRRLQQIERYYHFQYCILYGIWSIQDILSLVCVCKSPSSLYYPRPFELPPLLQYYCATCAQYTTPPRPSLVMPYTIPYW